MPIVANENMAAVGITSVHLMPPLVRSAGLSNAAMHWKKRTITIPRTMVKRIELATISERSYQCTITHCADDISGKFALLCEIQPGWGL